MELIKSFIAGALELGLFFAFGLPVILFAIAVFFFGFQEGNILSFKGRANRKSFIIKTLLILFGGLFLVGNFLLLAIKFRSYILTVTTISLFFGTLIAYYANMARRFHDLEMSAWWVLLFYLLSSYLGREKSALSFIPLICIILLAAIPGTKGPNKYGPDPLEKE